MIDRLRLGRAPARCSPVAFPLPGRFDRCSQVRHASHAPDADFLSMATNRIVQSHNLQAYTLLLYETRSKPVASLQRAKGLLLAN